MPIPLPLLSSEDIVKLPAPPADPPTDLDVVSAHYLVERLRQAHLDKLVTTAEFADGLVYHYRILAAAAGEELGWFPALKKDIQDIAESLQEFRADVRTLQTDVRVMNEHVRAVNRVSVKAYNRMRPTGHQAVLEIVPYPSGDDPTGAPHNLPALVSPEAVRALSDADRDAYYSGYYPNGTSPVHTRAQMILEAIGAGAA